MKNQYFGDINDYRKYGLLRGLQSGGKLRLLVAWMLTPEDGGRDGGLRSYLRQPEKWRRFDPRLFDGLAAVLRSASTPRVSLIEDSGLLPGSRFYPAVVPDTRRERGVWWEGLMDSASGADLVFVDPDNGIEIPSKPVGRADSSKYVAWSEIEQLWATGCSVLIYQHFRREPREGFAARMAAELRRRTGARFAHAIRTAHVLFLLVSQAQHEEDLQSAVSCLSKRWEGRIEGMRLDGAVRSAAAPRTAVDVRQRTAAMPDEALLDESISVDRLRGAIESLPTDMPRTHPGKWYRSQKEHWLGWLGGYGGPGAYGRKVRGKDAKYAYNHIVESKMLLWLIGEAGVRSELLENAREAADKASSMPAKSAEVRRHVPWSVLAEALWRADRGRIPDLSHPPEMIAMAPDYADVVAHVIQLEERALRRWCDGDPSGFLEISAADVVYFDPFLDRRIDGLPVLTDYYESLRGKVRAERFELIDPRVQLVGDAAVLTFNFVSHGGDGNASRWNCTEVFRRTGDAWKLIQTHWSFDNPERA